MKDKKVLGAVLITVVLIYFAAGAVFFGGYNDTKAQGRHLENNEGQEVELQMFEAEERAKEEVLLVDSQKEETVDKSELLSQIETSKDYLKENLVNVTSENENYTELLYHSAFFIALGEKYDSDNNKLVQTAKEIHTYLVNLLHNEEKEDTEEKLVEELQDISDETMTELVNHIME